MFCKLYGSSLVDVDVTAAHTDHTLILVEHGVNGGGVGLRAARQEEYLGIGQTARLTDTVLGSFRELIKAVGRGLGTIMSDQMVEHLLAGSVIIVTFK